MGVSEVTQGGWTMGVSEGTQGGSKTWVVQRLGFFLG